MWETSSEAASASGAGGGGGGGGCGAINGGGRTNGHHRRQQQQQSFDASQRYLGDPSCSGSGRPKEAGGFGEPEAAAAAANSGNSDGGLGALLSEAMSRMTPQEGASLDQLLSQVRKEEKHLRNIPNKHAASFSLGPAPTARQGYVGASSKQHDRAKKSLSLIKESTATSRWLVPSILDRKS